MVDGVIGLKKTRNAIEGASKGLIAVAVSALCALALALVALGVALWRN